MSKFKILKIIYVSTTATMLANIVVFAKGKYKTKTQENEGIKIIQQQKDAVLEQKSKKDISVKNKKQFKEDYNKKTNQKESAKDEIKPEYELETEATKETEDDSKQKENEDTKEINDLEIEGLKFKGICINSETNEPIYYNEKYNIILTKGDSLEGHIDFITPVKDKKGKPHAVEHLLFSNFIGSKKNKKKKWFSIGISFNNEFGRNNAFTCNLLDRTAIIQFNFSKELLKKGFEKEFQKFVDMFLGKAEFLIDNFEIFKREIKNTFAGKVFSRILHELLNRENPKDSEGLFNKAISITQDERYDAAGLYEETKKLTFKELKDFYFKYIVNNIPCLFLKFSDLEEAKRVIHLFKKYYYDKKENFNIPEAEKNKIFDYFKKIKLPKEMNNYFFKYSKTNNNKKIEKMSNYVLEAEYELKDFNDLKDWCFSFLDIEKFLKKAVDIKKYGFKNITFSNDENDRLVLKIYGDDRKLFERKTLENNLKKIEKDIINYINKNKITLDDIEKQGREKTIEEQIKKREYNISIIYRKILKSLAKYKTPFSEKYFTLDEDGKILNNYKKYIEYFEKNCSNIIKNSLEKNPIKIRVYEKSKENFDEKKAENFKQIKLPYKINSKNIAKAIIAEEIIVEFLTENLSDKGLIYVAIVGSNILNDHMHGLFNSEIEIFRNFFKKDFEKLLKNLKLDDSYIKNKIELYEKVAKKEQKNLETIEKETKASISSLKEILKDKNLNVKKIDKIIDITTEKIKINALLCEIISVVKLEKKDYEKVEEIIKNLNDIITNEFPKIRKDIQDNEKLDKKTNEKYRNLFNKEINLEQNLLKYIELLKTKNQKQINESKTIKTGEIKEILKNITVEDFDLVNKK